MTTRESVIDRIARMSDEAFERLVSIFEKYNYDLEAIAEAYGLEFSEKLN